MSHGRQRQLDCDSGVCSNLKLRPDQDLLVPHARRGDAHDPTSCSAPQPSADVIDSVWLVSLSLEVDFHAHRAPRHQHHLQRIFGNLQLICTLSAPQTSSRRERRGSLVECQLRAWALMGMRLSTRTTKKTDLGKGWGTRKYNERAVTNGTGNWEIQGRTQIHLTSHTRGTLTVDQDALRPPPSPLAFSMYYIKARCASVLRSWPNPPIDMHIPLHRPLVPPSRPAPPRHSDSSSKNSAAQSSLPPSSTCGAHSVLATQMGSAQGMRAGGHTVKEAVPVRSRLFRVGEIAAGRRARALDRREYRTRWAPSASPAGEIVMGVERAPSINGDSGTRGSTRAGTGTRKKYGGEDGRRPWTQNEEIFALPQGDSCGRGVRSRSAEIWVRGTVRASRTPMRRGTAFERASAGGDGRTRMRARSACVSDWDNVPAGGPVPPLDMWGYRCGGLRAREGRVGHTTKDDLPHTPPASSSACPRSTASDIGTGGYGRGVHIVHEYTRTLRLASRSRSPDTALWLLSRMYGGNEDGLPAGEDGRKVMMRWGARLQGRPCYADSALPAKAFRGQHKTALTTTLAVKRAMESRRAKLPAMRDENWKMQMDPISFGFNFTLLSSASSPRECGGDRAYRGRDRAPGYCRQTTARGQGRARWRCEDADGDMVRPGRDVCAALCFVRAACAAEVHTGERRTMPESIHATDVHLWKTSCAGTYVRSVLLPLKDN
ncbi:hypothetical protein DFH06DRAFT_1135909 [Mycena polygramma]|nr:hypothetical protein DFH06DRAFT_1135909 [Mycena polygramma]